MLSFSFLLKDLELHFDKRVKTLYKLLSSEIRNSLKSFSQFYKGFSKILFGVSFLPTYGSDELFSDHSFAK